MNTSTPTNETLLAAARSAYDAARVDGSHSWAFDRAVDAMTRLVGGVAAFEDLGDAADDLLVAVDDWAGEPQPLSSLAVEVQTRVVDAGRGSGVLRSELDAEFGADAVVLAILAPLLASVTATTRDDLFNLVAAFRGRLSCAPLDCYGELLPSAYRSPATGKPARRDAMMLDSCRILAVTRGPLVVGAFVDPTGRLCDHALALLAAEVSLAAHLGSPGGAPVADVVLTVAASLLLAGYARVDDPLVTIDQPTLRASIQAHRRST